MTTDTGKATITVRLIRSFDHRIIKHVVYHDVCLDQNVSDFKKFVKTELKTHSGLPPPFKIHNYDTLKISHQPFGAKTSDPVINKENDEELVLTDDKTLESCAVVCSLLTVTLILLSMITIAFANSLEPDQTQTTSKGIWSGSKLFDVNETELSFFNLEEYRAYQKNPTLNW